MALNWCKIILKSFNFWDALDIVAVAIIIFGIIKLVRETKVMQFIKGLLVIFALYLLSNFLKLKMLEAILGAVFQFGTLVIIVVFQPELRKILEHLGRSDFGKYFYLEKFLSNGSGMSSDSVRDMVSVISKTVFNLQKVKCGALIVFERKTLLGEIISTGTLTMARPSENLIANIFFNKSPLHDGAMVIKDNCIYACGCILPLSNSNSIASRLGTRHRAAIGVTENSDAVAVVVSEETGKVSIAVNGVLSENFSYNDFEETLCDLILPKSGESFTKFLKNFRNRA